MAKVNANVLAEEVVRRMTARVARFDDPAQPYRSREMPFRLSDKGDYDHLARVREWSLEIGAEE